MFELLNEDLENCIDILRQMTTSENKNEQLQILAEHRITKYDITKTVELCSLLIYYHQKIDKE